MTTLAAAVDAKAQEATAEDLDMTEVGEGEDGQRLMGRVEPIDKLGKEAEGIFKVRREEGEREGGRSSILKTGKEWEAGGMTLKD